MYLRGFSLLETIVVVAITAVVMTAVSTTIVYFYRTNTYVLEEISATQRARESVDQVLQDVREASYGDDGSYPVASAATSTLVFYANINSNTAIEKVHYYLSGSTFYRGTTASAGNPPSYSGQTEQVDIVVDNVRNGTSTPMFHYYDVHGNELTLPINVSQIASLKVVVMTDVNPNRAPVVYTLSGNATLRNLRNPATE